MMKVYDYMRPIIDQNGEVIAEIHENINYFEDYKEYLSSKYYRELTRRTRKGKRGYDIGNIITLDTECSSFEKEDIEYGILYMWQACINGIVVLGRTLQGLKELMSKLKANNSKRVVYVHNLGYDFQLLTNTIEFGEVHARMPRKPFAAMTKDKKIEFRCSYQLSGYSLENLGKAYNLTVQKLKGEMNHTKLRTPQTELTDEELGYCIVDPYVVYEYIKDHVYVDGYGVTKKLPYTQTSYVRVDFEEYIKEQKALTNYRKIISSTTPTPEEFTMLEAAYSGGVTHTNPMYTATIVDKVQSFDITSSYPMQMFAYKYPRKMKKIDVSKFYDCLSTENTCFVARVTFKNLRMSGKTPIAVISAHHAEFGRGSKRVIDNGRVWEAEELTVTICDVDFRTLSEVYDMDSFEVHALYAGVYSYLPKTLVEFMMQLYRGKTELKKVKGKESEYMHCKQLLNSIYGCCALNPFKDEIKFDSEKAWYSVDYGEITQNKLTDYYDNKEKVTLFAYSWCVWCTAYARRQLVELSCIIGDDVIYCDTDSIKCEGEHQNDVKEVNERLHKICVEVCRKRGWGEDFHAPKTVKGEVCELGQWDYEGTYDSFVSLGAKKYCTQTDGKLSVTVAGGNKSALLDFLDGDITKFKVGITLSGEYDDDIAKKYHNVRTNASGRSCFKYYNNREVKSLYIKDCNGKWAAVRTHKNYVYTCGASFSMNMSDDYERFLMYLNGDLCNGDNIARYTRNGQILTNG